MVRALRLHRKGHRFESCIAHQNRKSAKKKIRKTAKMDTEELNILSNKVIGIAINVHRILGPGFIEKIYQQALAKELGFSKIDFEQEKVIRINYKNELIGEQRIDFLIENELILEIKSTEKIGNIHISQLLSYLKTLDKKLDLILNFAQMQLGIKRVVNKL